MGNSCKLYNCDCLEYIKKIPDKSIDLILTDPPYEISRDTNFLSGTITADDTCRFRISMQFGDWDIDFKGLDEIIKECYRILKKSGTLICFYDIWKITNLKKYFENANFKQLRFIEWVKTNPIPINNKINYLTNAREIAVVGVKGTNPTFNSEYDHGIYCYPICQEKGRFHPTQKPVSLLKTLIDKHSNEGDLIFDCFAGSASTAVAAHIMHRNFIGCEISKDYYDKSMDRLKSIGAVEK